MTPSTADRAVSCCTFPDCGETGTPVANIGGVAVAYACGAHADAVIQLATVEERRHRSYLVEELILRAGDRRAEQTLATFPRDQHTEKALAAIEKWQAAYRLDAGWPPRNLVVHGPVGTGKTGLVVALMRNLIEDDEPAHVFWRRKVEFVVVPRLLAEVKASFAGGDDPEYDFSRPLLVLDDLGAERVTDWTRDYLAGIVERRYDDGQVTIVTSNYAPSTLARRLGHDDPMIGERIVSRLIEDAIVVRLAGPNRRKRNPE